MMEGDITSKNNKNVKDDEMSNIVAEAPKEK